MAELKPRSPKSDDVRRIAGEVLRALGKVLIGLLLIAVIGIGLILGICTLMR